MPVTIKKSQLMYKNPSTGEYVSVDAVADKTSQQQINGINTAASNAIASINTAMQDIDTQPLTTLPKKAYKKDLVANEETLASAATHAYAVGDYFFVADNNNDISLYKATAAIAVGATISPGTGIDNNCVPAALANDVTSLSNDIGTVEANLGVYAKVKGYYINLTADPVNLANPLSSSTGLAYSIIDCVEGDVFMVNAEGGANARAWAFIDSSNHAISMANVNVTVTNLELTAPENAVKLVINDKGGYAACYKVGNNIASKISKIDSLETSTSEIRADLGYLNEVSNPNTDSVQITWRNDGAGRILIADGTVASSQMFQHTDYVDIRAYKTVRYKTVQNNGSTVTYGTGLYDKDKVFIRAISAVVQASALGYGNAEFEVTDDVAYARFTIFTDTSTYGEFTASGITALHDIISQINLDTEKLLISQYASPGGNLRESQIKVGKSILSSNGATTSNSARAIVGYMLKANSRRMVKRVDPTYEYRVHIYRSGSSGEESWSSYYVGDVVSGGEWIADNRLILVPESAERILLSFKRADGATISTSEKLAIAQSVSFYVATDNTLTQEYVPADAKAVKDSLDRNNVFAANDDVQNIDTYDGVIALYDALATAYPNYVTKNTLTYNGVTNYEYVFTSGNYNSKNGRRVQDDLITKPTILLSSGIHGDEQSAVMSLYVFMKSLCENRMSLRSIRDYATIRVMPVLNPWGYTNNSRQNANGINLNRNFDVDTWEQSSDSYNGSGNSPADQTETVLIQNWIDSHTDAIFLIDWHNSAYTTEISCILGGSTVQDLTFKKRCLLGVNDIIPYWRTYRSIPDSGIYIYSGAGAAGGTVKAYGNKVGIMSFTFETSWNVLTTGKHSDFTIGTGAEAFANMMIGLKEYFKDI